MCLLSSDLFLSLSIQYTYIQDMEFHACLEVYTIIIMLRTDAESHECYDEKN